MSRWREDIKKAVSEGKNYAIYSHTLLPSAQTDLERLAMKLVHFKKIESSGLDAKAVDKTKEEKAVEITHRIVCSTKITELIAVTAYLSTSESDTDDNDLASSMQSKASGTAVKQDTNNWHVYLNNQMMITATDQDLLDPNKFHAEHKCMSVDNNEATKKKQSVKQKRAHKGEQIMKEKQIMK